MSHVQTTRRLNAAPRNVARAAALLCASLAMPYSAPLMAADTAIENEPLATRPASKAKPNLMVILDDSGSMNWSYMPDSLGASNDTTDEPYSSWYGYRSSQCNGVAYDPNITYTPPIKADGESYGNASYPKARPDGYLGNVSGNGEVDLSGHVFYTYKGTQDKMGWTYTADETSPVNDDFYKECKSNVGDTPGKNVFTQVKVSDLSAAEKTNYANWFSYYRKRYLLMRTAMGRAIFGLNDGYRVGFTAINDDNNFIQSNSSTFVNVDDFTASHKTRLFKSLYGIGPGGGTPLRQALANTGRYFAKKHDGQKDPLTLSCQRNYALLTTDGYWNGSNGKKLDGTSIGQEDGSEARPMSDATSLNLKVVTTYEVTETRNSTTTSTWLVPGKRIKTTVNSKAEKSGDYQGLYKVTTQAQTTKSDDSNRGTRTKTVITPQQRTVTRTITITKYENGTESAPSINDTAGNWDSSAAPETSWSEISWKTKNTNWTDSGSATISYQAAKGSGSPVYSDPEATGEGVQSGGAITTYGTESEASVTQKGDPKTTPETTGGASPTLADVAQYYWATDLRNGTNCSVTVKGPDGKDKTVDVCTNNVPSSDADPAKYQHLNTFGIGLGVNGTLKSSDFEDLKKGKKTWPNPFNNVGAVRIDDLWHAAVNGRGEYYSALSASALSSAIAGVIAKIDEVNGASSAAATSALELVAGDNNLLYSASYTTGAWTGDLAAYVLTGETGEASKIKKWSSQALLDNKAYADRKIYIKSGTTSLALFTYDNLSTTQKAHFDKICDQPSAPSQCASLQPKAKAAANLGANLVNYLRGDRTYEADVGFKEDPNSDTVTPATLYRPRDHVLGDIINGAPVYVGQPPFKYADTGYADFKATSRTAMVYAAANDGMLHAFDANSGEEQWAYIPSAVIPNLYKLADTNYAGKHQYFVDGAPVMGDIKVGTEWKTILVGGLNKGGKAYYALDITNPAAPKLLWEFTHSNLGLTYGNPVITKNAAGTWIVAFGSGYNNNEGSGDGKGRLFIVNANTGAEIVSGGIATSEGTDTAPSGMAKINAWIEDASDNTTTRFYGADLEGNVWRFDYEGLVEPKNKSFKLGTLTVSGTPQPITTKPLLLQSGGKPVVIVGTGRYLGEADITDATVQSIYAIKDPLTDSGWGNIRANASFVKQTFTLNNAAKTATISKNPVNWSTNAGWWVDLPHEKERISTPMSLQLTTLVIPSTIPSGDNCQSGGSSWMYYLNAANGSVINKDTVGSEVSPDSLIVGTGWFADSEGNLRLSRQNSQGDRDTVTPPVAGSGGSGNAHRTSWRELID